VDGGYTDAASLALAIGNYQAVGDLSKRLKVILTNTNEVANDTQYHPMLDYFSNHENQHIVPGAYFWPQESVPGPSLQIFGEYLDYTSLLSLSKPIEGTNLTTAIINATTVDNGAYGVKAGQTVEIMLIDLNAEIPTVIVGQAAVDEYAAPLAAMAVGISLSEALRNQVKAFTVSHHGSISSAATTARKSYVWFFGLTITLSLVGSINFR
jgi:hypothetical protein